VTPAAWVADLGCRGGILGRWSTWETLASDVVVILEFHCVDGEERMAVDPDVGGASANPVPTSRSGGLAQGTLGGLRYRLRHEGFSG
jgi:hypothetical protein